VKVGAVLDDDGVLDVRFRLRPVAVVNQEHAAAGIQARPHELPERAEASPRDVRQPEGEEHDVVALFGAPLEEIREHVLDVSTSDAVAVQRQRLG
jgi:hypothetical protein